MKMVVDNYDFRALYKTIVSILKDIREGDNPVDFAEDIVRAILDELGIEVE